MTDKPVVLVTYNPVPLAEKIREALNDFFRAEGKTPDLYTPVELTKMLASLAAIVAGIVESHPDPNMPLHMFDQFVRYSLAANAGTAPESFETDLGVGMVKGNREGTKH